MKQLFQKTTLARNLGAVAGVSLFAFAYNFIVLPCGLYNGGMAGIAQIFCQILQRLLGQAFPALFAHDLTGLAYWLLNLPIFVLAGHSCSRRFFWSSAAMVCIQSVLLLVLPVPTQCFIPDRFAAAVVGGLLMGYGVGLTLTCGASGGGMDILGVYFTQRHGVSVGRVSALINLCIYAYALFYTTPDIIVYSAIYSLVGCFVMDRAHYQNVKTTAFIISKMPGIETFLLKELNRGVTIWQGYGGYTKEATNIYFTLISRYEALEIKRRILSFDPSAFVVFSAPSDMIGIFQNHLEV